ncbi:hypothetical protein Slu03_19160 [Sediminihabitans luteus]|nr:hypothetical protein Slu03_19160 [Sediminihabitans luteus]
MRVTVLAAVADVACVVALALGGYRAHDTGDVTEAILRIVWPFLAGTAVGWVLARAWRRPTVVAPVGIIVWGATWSVGLILRALTDQGTAPAFQLVSFGFLAVLMLGWRGVVQLVEVLSPRDRRRRAAELAGRRPPR